MRVLSGRAIRLSHQFLDDEDVLALSQVNVSLRNMAGAEVANAAAILDSDMGGGTWNVSLPAQPLGLYRAEWIGDAATDTTYVEVVGGFLFSIPEVRNSDDDLKDAQAFPGPEIREQREVVEWEFERITGRSFVERVREVSFTADGTPELVALIPDASAVVSARVNGVAVEDVSDWTVSPFGKITSPTCLTDGARVVVAVRYGFATPPPNVKRVGIVRLRSLLAAKDSGIPDRATSWQPQEGGTFRLATPGMGNWKTGIPEVDSTLADYTLDVVLDVMNFV